MDKNVSDISFRTSLGGFNKQDVIRYISDANRRFVEAREMLEAKVAIAETKAANSASELAETRKYFQSEIKKKDAEIERLTKENAEISDNALGIANENEHLKELLRDCEQRLNDYNDKLVSIQSSIENERELLKALQVDNEQLKNKYAALDSEYCEALSQLERIKKSFALSDEISTIIGEIRDKNELLDEKLAAYKKVSGVCEKNTDETGKIDLI